MFGGRFGENNVALEPIYRWRANITGYKTVLKYFCFDLRLRFPFLNITLQYKKLKRRASL